MSTLDLTNLRVSNRSSNFATARNYAGSYLLVTPAGDRIVDCRSYWAGGMTNRARVWLRKPYDPNFYYGIGSSTGIGYDRAGAALADALEDAGVKGLPNLMSGEGYILKLLRGAMIELWGEMLIKIETHE